MLLVESVSNRRVVVQACERSVRAGVKPGMNVAHAQALLGADTRVQPHQPQRVEATLTALSRWAWRFTPIVQPDPPDGLLLEISGCEHLHGGTRPMLRHVVDQARQLGLQVRGALAPTVGAAWALARFGRPGGIIEDNEAIAEALAALPVRALRVDEDAVQALRAVAVETVGQLRSLPRASLAERFGTSLLLRLDQATGQAFEAVEPIRSSEPVCAEREFAGPVKQLEAILQTGRALVQQLCQQLTRHEAGARQLRLELERIDTGNLHETLTLSRPSREVEHLWRLLRPRLEQVHMGFGIERMVLRATAVGTLPHQQASVEGWRRDGATRATEREIGELADRYVGRLGADRVSMLQVKQTHVPEQVFVHRPFAVGRAGAVQTTPVVDADRPTLLYGRPEAVRVVVLSPDGPVMAMRRDAEHVRIVRSIGPERITPRWWLVGDDARKPPPRDYYKVQDEHGRWWWIFRQVGTSNWFVHGRWC